MTGNNVGREATSTNDMRAEAASLFVLGDYWQPGCSERSLIGQLVHRAKDHADTRAATDLVERFAQLAEALRDAHIRRGDRSRGGRKPSWLFVAVPPSSDTSGFQLSAALAQALAEASGGRYLPDAVVRTIEGPRMRDLPPSLRTAAAAGAGYEVRASVAGWPVVVVDDVILTGATLGEITARLQDAGAIQVVAAVAARTRRSK